MSSSITKIVRTETAHRLDGHPGRCQFVHGHSYVWEVTATGFVDEETGMLMDFKDFKELLNEFIDPFDHALVLELGDEDSPEMKLYEALRESGLLSRVIFTPYRPTAENMAQVVAGQIAESLDRKFTIKVKLWETATSYAEAMA